MRKILTYVLSIGLSVALFYLAYSRIDNKEELWSLMRTVRWEGVALSFLMGYLAIVSRGLRWELLLKPLGRVAPPGRRVNAVMFGYFANTFIPRGGELARCAALNQTDDIPVDELFGTVISERVVDFVFLGLFTLIAVLGNAEAFADFLSKATLPDQNVIAAGLIGLAFFIGLIVAFRKALMRLSIFEKVSGFLKGVWNGLNSIRKMKLRGLFIAHTLFIWSMYFLMAWVIIRSFEGANGMHIVEGMFIVVAGGFGMIIPAQGGAGSYQFAVMSGFVALGYQEEMGMAIGNVIWFTQTAMIIIMGGLAYLMLLRYRMKKNRV